jgi:hypothetical protein
VIAQAHAAIPLAERRCEPVPLDACQRWLSAVALLCVQSGTRAEVQAWMSAMSSVLGDYPAGCFTAATLKQAARAGNGWRPSYAAMAKILDPVAADVSVAPTRLRQIVNAGVASDRDRSRPINRPALEPGPKYTSGTWADCVHRLRNGTACASDIWALYDARKPSSYVSDADREMVSRAWDEVQPALPQGPVKWPQGAPDGRAGEHKRKDPRPSTSGDPERS